jgi:hypothetical protein
MGNLPAKLREVGRAVNALTDGTVNYGGCGVYATLICERLEALGVKAEVIVPDWSEVGSVEAARNNLMVDAEEANDADWVNAGISFHHVGVRFEWKGAVFTHDTDVTRNGGDQFGKDPYDALPDGMTAAEMRVAAITDPVGWNNSYDTEFTTHIEALVRGLLR